VPDDRERNVVLIEADGRVKLDSEAQRRLAGHPGKFRVVPTTGEIMILQRVADSRAAASVSAITAGRVTLAGEVDAVGGLVDVINFILSQAWSGQLAIIDGSARKTIYFRRGDVRTAASNVNEDRLGAILYRFGVVSEAELQAAVNAVGAAKLGQVLVEQGKLTPHDLYTYVRKQVEEIFFSVLVMRAGAFYFYRTDEDQGPVSQLSLSTKQLLFDGVRRIDELGYFREKLPSNEVVLQRRHPAPPTKLDPKEERVLGLVDGARDIAAISRASHLGEFETTKVLYQLVTSGFIDTKLEPVVKLAASARPGDSLQDIFGKVVDAFNEVYAKIYNAVAQRGKAQPLLKGLESFFGSVAEFAPLFVGLSMDERGTLSRDQLLANLNMAPTDDKLDYLHRGLNELLFFELFTAGEAVDRREEIELHQRLNQIIRDRGAVPPRTATIVAEPGDANEEAV
jgi:hypothetical protein